MLYTKKPILNPTMFRQLFLRQAERSFIQFFRYGLVVAIAAPIDLGGYILLKSQLHLQVVLAATISFVTSLIVNYYLSIAWVWSARSGNQRHIDAAVFAIIGFVGLGLTDLIVWLLNDLIHVNYIVAKFVAFAIVFFWSFGARHILFQSSRRRRDSLRFVDPM